MSEVVLLRVRNDLGELDRMSRALDDFAIRYTLPPQTKFELTLALDEVLTNVISYAYADSAEHEIIIRLMLADSVVRIEVEDDGRPFDPLAVPPPDTELAVDERPIGGLGVHLVRRVTDGLEYRRESGRNILIMTKQLARPATAS